MLKKSMKIEACFLAILSLVFLSATAFGQSGVPLSGTVQDTSGGVIQGASITVRNIDTGVETRARSNDRGLYNFPSLPVGTYNVAAEASGFARSEREARLNVGAQPQLNFVMSVVGITTEVEVTGVADSVILESGASTGTVLQEETLTSIPLLSNNVLELINLMGGVSIVTGSPVFDASTQTFAGVASNQINVTRDGMSVGEVRYATGINAATNINTEMVGEFRMVLSPVDAEMGRGAGQVQMTTRSGSNTFHGSGIWNVQNTVLDAEDFDFKRREVPKSWRNLNSYQLTASGPIIRNKSFFFATWEQQWSRSKEAEYSVVLTPCARKGIYRYPHGFRPDAVSAAGSATFRGNNPIRQSVKSATDGSYLESGTLNDAGNQEPTPFNNPLRFESVFGNLTPAARAALLGAGGVYDDCSAITINPGYLSEWSSDTNGLYTINGNSQTFEPNSYWGQNAFRYAYDPTGYIDRFSGNDPNTRDIVRMPEPNDYTRGDGLNYASHRWTRPLVGSGGSIWGTGGDPDRKSITFKIDHNINNDHRLSGTYTRESFYVDDGYAHWPKEYGGYGGGITRKPQTFLVSLTSTLRPTLLNEARVGLSQTDTWTLTAVDARDGDKMKESLRALFPTGSGTPFAGTAFEDRLFLLAPGQGAMSFSWDSYTMMDAATSHPFGSRGNTATSWGGKDPRWTIADTVTWMKGAHSFKGGVEYRWQKSTQEFEGNRSFSFWLGEAGYTDMAMGFGGNNNATLNRLVGGNLNPDGTTRPDTPGNFTRLSNQNSWVGVTRTTFGDTTAENYSPMDNGDGARGSAPTGNWGTPYNLMSYFSGSMRAISQYFYMVPDSSYENGARWNDIRLGEDYFRYGISNQELSFFFKDDWKITSDLTLNLGVRWEYFGVPHASDGRTLGLVGGSSSVYGISGESFNAYGISPKDGFKSLMTQRKLVEAPVSGYVNYGNTEYLVMPYADPVTRYQFIGPGSINSDIKAWNKDMNNFAPHIGFAYQLPWFGRGMTTLRGGWSVSYSPVNNFDQYGIQLASVAAVNTDRVVVYRGMGNEFDLSSTRYYMDYGMLPQLLPMNDPSAPENGSIMPMTPSGMGQNAGFLVAIDENIKNPYTHSLNMSVTRNIGRNLTVDLRYIGTFGRSMIGSLNLNQSNWLQTGLYSELERVRQGGESDLINSLIPTGTLSGKDGLTGSGQIRDHSSTRNNLYYGQFSDLVGTLSNGNGDMQTLNTTYNGYVSRAGCLPQDRLNPSGDMTDHVGNPCLKGTPWNYFYTNPQYGSTDFQYNASMSNYHSMQTQVTMRPTHGVNFQATWTWSRAIGDSGWTNLIGDRDYLLSGQHRSHTLNTYGSWELPFGPRGLLFREASGVFKKAVDGWQLSWVSTMATGTPISASGTNTLWGNSWSVLVRPDLWNDKAGKVDEIWREDGTYGGAYYFGSYSRTANGGIVPKYTKVLDTGICNPSLIPGFGVPGSEYATYCGRPPVAPDPANGIEGDAWYATHPNLILPSTTRTPPRAIALADPSGAVDGNGAVLPQLYTQDTWGADGILYRAGDPIIVFRNADQRNGIGAAGNYKANRLTGPGRYTFDLALSKSIEFMEGKRFEIRVDAQNIFNHAQPTPSTAASSGGRQMSSSNPTFGVNSTAADDNSDRGWIATKGGHRTFQARLRFSF